MEPLARPAHRRKLSNANGLLTFSSKNAYDDVFAAVPPPSSAAAKLKRPVGLEEYGEIFGGSSRGGSSVPVLDLSALDGERRTGAEDRRSSSKKQLLDYAKIFGGFRDEDIAVPYEELVAQKSKKSSSDKAAMNQSDEESLLRGAENCRLSGKNIGHSSEASDPSLDGVKQVNMSYHKSSPRGNDGTNGRTHIATLHAVPGFTYFIDETARQQKTEGDRPVPKVKSEPQRTWSFGGNIHEENNARKTEMPMPNKSTPEGPVPKVKCEPQRTWSFGGNIHEENNARKTEMPMPNKSTPEGVHRGKRGSWWDGPCSNAKLFYSGEINPKSNSFKSSSSSSPPAKLSDINGHPKQSRSSNFASKANAFEKAGEYITCSSDEELDMNSAAAASAAALKKAIEQAQESIRLAKELMERKKDGFEGYSKPSTKGKNRKESRIEHEAKHIKEKNSKETFDENIDDVLQGFAGRNRKTALQSDEVATTFEHSKKPSASRKDEVEKRHRDVVRAFAETASLSDLGSNGNHRTTTSASGQIKNKNTTMDKQACNFDEMKSSEETSECIKINVEKTKGIEQDIGLGNAESRTNVQQEAQESEETINKSGFALKLPEYGVSDNLKITPEDILIEDIRDGFDEWQECEKEFQESPDIIKEEKLEPSRLDGDYLCKESQKVVEQKEPKETSQQECVESGPVDVLVKEKENGNGLGSSCKGASGLVQEEACQFAEMDDKPIEVLGIRSCGQAQKDTVEGEENERSDLIPERDIDEMVLIHAYNGKETHRILDGKLKEEEVEELDVKEMEPIDAYDGDTSEKLLMEEKERKEFQLTCEQTYNCVQANHNIPEEEFVLGEVENRTKDAHVNEATESLWIEANIEAQNRKVEVMQEAEEDEVMQEAEEAKSVHLEADNCDTNHEIGFLQRAACDWDSELEVQEASRFEVSNENVKTCPGTVEKRVDTCSTPAANDAFYQCERDVEEGGIKEASELEGREISEGGHFVQSAYQEQVISCNVQSDSKTIDSDGSGENVHYSEISHADELSVGSTFETADLLQHAVKENYVNIQPQTSEAHRCDEKSAHTASSENRRQKEIEENVEVELSSNPEIGGGLVHESGKNAENVKEVDVSFDKEEKGDDIEVDNKQRSMQDDSKEAESTSGLAGESNSSQVALETYEEMKTVDNVQPAVEHRNKSGAMEGKEVSDTKEKDDSKKIDMNKKDRDRNTDRIAVERAIREARERAFLDARERAGRAAVERAAAEVRQRQMAEARGKIEKATGGSKLVDKASIKAKMRAERAAVERATAEARERALEKALSQKSTTEAKAQAEMLSGASRDNGLKHSFSSSDLETSSESAQRRKARLERHQRIMERVARALEEKNMRDLQAQKEQAERNRLAETLDADIKRWASGKEGNLRALISTLQYILGPDSGWQPISLTEIITTAAVKKAYRKATLYVHPDKLQQRGASIQQKYICEKVFDLLKAAWNRFNSEER